jgi:Sec-independent protein translocase protein TatA
MFGYGQEILLILVLAFFVFGPSEFPKVAKVIAKALGDLRRMGDEVRSTVESHLSLPDLNEELAPGGSPVVSTLSTPPGVSNVADAPLRQAPDAPLAESGDHAGQRVPAPGAPEVARSAYWAQRGSRLIHGGQCVWAARIPDSERVSFDTVEHARAQGYVSCPVCDA